MTERGNGNVASVIKQFFTVLAHNFKHCYFIQLAPFKVHFLPSVYYPESNTKEYSFKNKLNVRVAAPPLCATLYDSSAFVPIIVL